MDNIKDMNNMEIMSNLNLMVQELRNRNILLKDDNDISWYLDKIIYNQNIDEIIFTCETNQ